MEPQNLEPEHSQQRWSRRIPASRRYEAAGWLRKMVGVVVAKDLPVEPSEQEFRLDLEAMETKVSQHAGIIGLYGMGGVGKISMRASGNPCSSGVKHSTLIFL